jgi:hypothetical protein
MEGTPNARGRKIAGEPPGVPSCREAAQPGLSLSRKLVPARPLEPYTQRGGSHPSSKRGDRPTFDYLYRLSRRGVCVLDRSADVQKSQLQKALIMRLLELLHEFERGSTTDNCMKVVTMQPRSKDFCSLSLNSSGATRNSRNALIFRMCSGRLLRIKTALLIVEAKFVCDSDCVAEGLPR